MRNLIAAVILCVMALASTAYADNKALIKLRNLDQMKSYATELFTQGKYDQALPILKEILQVRPDDKTAQRYLFIYNNQVKEPFCKEAASAYLGGNYQIAITSWNKILKIDPTDTRIIDLINETLALTQEKAVEIHYAAVEELINKGEYENAASELKKILAANPGDKRAADMLETVKITLGNSVIKGLYDQANALLKEAKYDAAIAKWREILKMDPDQKLAVKLIASTTRLKLESMYQSARDFYMKGEYMSSVDLYNRILIENPEDLAVRGIVERLNKTMKVVSKLTDRGRVWDVERTALANYIDDEGNSQVAVLASWYGLQLEPEQELVTAIRDFLERENIAAVRALEPPDPNMTVLEQYLFDALTYIYEGRYDLAIRKCSLVLAIDKNSVLAYKRLGSAYLMLGNNDRALSAWKRGLDLDPQDEELKEFISIAM